MCDNFPMMPSDIPRYAMIIPTSYSATYQHKHTVQCTVQDSKLSFERVLSLFCLCFPQSTVSTVSTVSSWLIGSSSGLVFLNWVQIPVHIFTADSHLVDISIIVIIQLHTCTCTFSYSRHMHACSHV